MTRPPLGFSSSLLVRHGAERDESALARHAASPDALAVILAGEAPILGEGPGGRTALHPASVLARLPEPLERVYLGTSRGRPVLAAALPPGTAEALPPGLEALDLRSIAVQGAVEPGELGVLATAKSLLSWHAGHRFCSRCGSPTELTASGFRRDCPSCGAQHFPRTDPVVIMLVHRGDSCLLGRQSRFTPGTYSCLAGFLEPGETIEDAVRRETFEEAGIRVGEVRYETSQPWPFPASLMIGCSGEALDGEIRVDREELEDARWFDREELRAMVSGRHPDGLRLPPPIAIARHLAERFLAGESR